MNKIIILLLLFTGSLAAQDTADTLTVKRGIFISGVYRKGVRLNNTMLLDLYAKNKAYDAEKQLKHSRFMLPTGAAVSVAGFAVSIHALAGKKHSVYVDNVEYTYYKRPIMNLLGGIGMIAAGVCLMEFGNDKKIYSVDLYNKKKKYDVLTPSIGLNQQGHLGLKWSF
ncbi:MAG: hypothetical protein KF870_09110 [Leadbetterella sp.]|nr:hypothetical protein [Leadbetterella sp.]